MVMQVMRRGRFSGVIKFGFLTLLVLGTFGLVLSDVRGVLTGSAGGSDVAAIGGETISLASFDRTLSRTLPRLGISPQEAYQLGYMSQLLNNELRGYALQIAARETGIEVSRDQIARQVAKIVEPAAGDGGNKQEILEQILRSQGMTEPEFVAQVGRESASGLLSEALAGVIAEPSADMLETLYLFENETRDVELITFPHATYKLEKEPDETALKTAYEGLKENFAIPESRDIDIIVIDDTALKAAIDVTEEEVRKIYDEDKNAFVVQESRKVEQAIVKEADKAQSIAKLTTEGKPLKEAVKEIMGDEKTYLGEIDFEILATQEALRNVVFDGTKNIGKVLGPVETPLGHHIMIVKKITPPSMKPFESVKQQIKKEQLEIKSADQMFEASGTLDDLLASGTAIEDIKKEIPLKIISIKGIRQTGQDSAGKDLLADFKDDASVIIQTSFGLLEGETSPVTELSDGRYAAIHAAAITPKTYKPFEEIKAQLKQQTIDSDKATQNRLTAKALQERINKGEATLSSLSEELKKPIKALSNLKKTGEAPDPLITPTLGFIFAAKEKESFILDIKDGIAVVVVTKTTLPKASADAKALDELKKKLETDERAEVLEVYVGMKMQDYGISVNEGLLRQFYGAKSLDDATYQDTGGLF